MKRLAVGLALGGAAIALLAWWRVRDRDAPAPRPQPTAAVAPAAAPSPASPPSSPGLPPGAVAPIPPIVVPPPAPSPPAGPAAAFPFDDEPRDAAWADDHERELAHRLRAIAEDLEDDGVAARIGAPECRRTLCRVALTADDAAALGKVYGALETERGLVGWADTMMLERVVTGDDGRVETRVVAQFLRDEP